MQRARLAVAAAVMVLAATTAGCGSGGDAPAHAPAPPVGADATTLVKELDRIRSTDASRSWTSYGDLAAQRRLGHGTFRAELRDLSVYGWSTTWERGPEAEAQLALSGGDADRVVEVGEQDGAGRFDGGVDTAAVIAKARKLGAREDGTVGPLALWRLAPDNEDHLSRDLVVLSRGTADFDVLATDRDTLVRAPSRARARVLAADGRDDTLARDRDYRAAAECLGAPLAATFTDVHVTTVGGTPKKAGFVTGAGVSGDDPQRLAQTACRTTSSREEAEQVADALRDELAHGRTRLSDLAWRTMFSRARVRVLDGPGHVVRLTATSRKSPELVLEMLRGGDLSDLLDTSD